MSLHQKAIKQNISIKHYLLTLNQLVSIFRELSRTFVFSERTLQNEIPVRYVGGSNLLWSPESHEVHLLRSPRSHEVHLLRSPISHEVHFLWCPRSHKVHLLQSPGSCGSSIGGPVSSGIWLDWAYVGASNVSFQARIGGRPNGIWTLGKWSVLLFDRPASLAGRVVWNFASTFSQSVTGFGCSHHFHTLAHTVTPMTMDD